MQQTPLLFILLLFSLFYAHAQGLQPGTLAKKQVSAGTLGPRKMIVQDPFDANRVLRQLFPGKYYDLGPRFGGRTDRLINWVCPACKPRIVGDANGMDTAWFPDPGGVATRPLTVFAYTGDSGRQYKLISFNHSGYDEDGFQVGRFSGGILGMARFARVDSGWRLELFQPPIGAYGAFAQCPAPKPLLIGDGQYAFMIEHNNGAPGGPITRRIT